MNDHAEHKVEPRPKPNNLRTGLLLAALALFFFVLLFVKRLWLG
jgi:hypothetical protein